VSLELGTKQILVTGGLGWLGRGLIEALIHGLPDVDDLRQPDTHLQIRALILPDQDAGALQRISDRITVITGDIGNREDCRRFCADAEDAVLFHAAGVVHPRRVREFYEVNVDGTRNVLYAAVAANVRRAVVVSSNSPCGCNPSPDHLFDESSPYHPYRHYGRSKMQMEIAVREIQETGRMETVIVRPPWFYGPFQPPRQTEFFRMVRDGKGPVVGGGENRRSMGYIDNVAQGLIRAAYVERANGQTYWIADERPFSMNEILDTIERLLEKEFGQACTHNRLRLPGLVSDAAGIMDGTIQGTGFYNQKIHVLSEMNKTIACSVRKAKEELGYRPAIALEEGMRRSIRWCLDQGIVI
jgi:nucleoside-diphosphate-sugar epimerase